MRGSVREKGLLAMKAFTRVALGVVAASLLALAAWAQQGVVVVDKLQVEDGGDLFHARSLESGKRYWVKLANCRAIPGEVFVVVVVPGKGMGTYSSTGTFCLISEQYLVP